MVDSLSCLVKWFKVWYWVTEGIKIMLFWYRAYSAMVAVVAVVVAEVVAEVALVEVVVAVFAN